MGASPMINSSYEPEANHRLLLETGLTILTDEIRTWFDGHVTYQWMIASKPSH